MGFTYCLFTCWLWVFLWTFFTIFITYRWRLISFKTTFSRSILTITLTWLSFLFLLLSLSSSSLHHFSELLMLSSLLILFFLFILSSFSPFFFHSTSRPSSSIPKLILKDRFVINVLDGRYLSDDSLPVMWNLFGKLVILHIKYSNIRQFD